MARTVATGIQDFSKIIEKNYFFSVKHAGRNDLFENLNVWKEEKYRKLQGTYPVIFLSFANVKGNDYETVRKRICRLIANLYEDHRFLLESGWLGTFELRKIC